jgi:hypothetical protein
MGGTQYSADIHPSAPVPEYAVETEPALKPEPKYAIETELALELEIEENVLYISRAEHLFYKDIWKNYRKCRAFIR